MLFSYLSKLFSLNLCQSYTRLSAKSLSRRRNPISKKKRDNQKYWGLKFVGLPGENIKTKFQQIQSNIKMFDVPQNYKS